VLLFQDAAGRGGLPYFIPFLMFLFLLALGEDYNILVMTRIREEAGRVPLRQAVPRALERTGSTVALLGRWNWWPSRHGVAAGEVSEGQQLAGTCGR
jgi:putative drug exporter of the RND superfamily